MRRGPPAGVQAGAFRFADEAGTVCIIAGGPSVTAEAVGQCRHLPTIAVNDAYRLAPWAGVLYACDGKWWDHHIQRVRDSGFAGETWTQDAQAASKHGLRRIVGEFRPGLSRDPSRIHFGSSSGYQAINLAYHWGARQMVLLGFDCRMVDGQRHWFGNHPQALNQGQPFGKWVENFARLAADLEAEGVTVYNCSPVSALTCWPKVSVEQALASCLSHPVAA